MTFWSALIYFLVAHYGKLLTPRRAKLLLGVFLISNYLYRAVINPDFNFFKVVGLEDLFYRLTRIPPSNPQKE